jgi:hypothetical protein
LLGKFIKIRDFTDCEQSRTKTHENTVYSSSIRQANHWFSGWVRFPTTKKLVISGKNRTEPLDKDSGSGVKLRRGFLFFRQVTLNDLMRNLILCEMHG